MGEVLYYTARTRWVAHDVSASFTAAMNAASGPAAQEAYDLLATMVAIVRADATCLLVNSALEVAMRQSRGRLVQGSALAWFVDPQPLQDTLQDISRQAVAVSRFDALLKCHLPGAHELPVHVTVTPVARGGSPPVVVIEMQELSRQAWLGHEERMHELVQAHRELLRNLAHEIRNPLGGIRGAAQLLAMEATSPALAGYTELIIGEADRLQSLVDRLLAPQRGTPARAELNIHEVCEHVRTLVLAEFPHGLAIQRDYDISLPTLHGDRERLIQALLNLVRNAAQALAVRIAAGDACIVLRTRVARQPAQHRGGPRLTLELQVEDNGPGVPPAIAERIFQPLVSGHEQGHGLGLTLAQTFVQQHGGTIGFDSQPGKTTFTLWLPLGEAGVA